MSSLPQANIAEEHFLLGNVMDGMLEAAKGATAPLTKAVTAVADTVVGNERDEDEEDTEEQTTSPAPGTDDSPVDDEAEEIKTQNDVFKKEKFDLSNKTEGFTLGSLSRRNALINQAFQAFDISVPYFVATLFVSVLMVFCLFMLINVIIRHVAAPGPYQTYGRYVQYPKHPWQLPGNKSELPPLDANDFVMSGSDAVGLQPAAAQERIDNIKQAFFGEKKEVLPWTQWFNPATYLRWGHATARVGLPITRHAFDGPVDEAAPGSHIYVGAQVPDIMNFQNGGIEGTEVPGWSEAKSRSTVKHLYFQAHRQLMREGQDLFAGGPQGSPGGAWTENGAPSDIEVNFDTIKGKQYALFFMIFVIVTYWIQTNKIVANLEKKNSGKGLALKKDGPMDKKMAKGWMWLVSSTAIITTLVMCFYYLKWYQNTKNNPAVIEEVQRVRTERAAAAAAPLEGASDATVTGTAVRRLRDRMPAWNPRRWNMFNGSTVPADGTEAGTGVTTGNPMVAAPASGHRAPPPPPAVDLLDAPSGGDRASVFGKKTTRRTRGAAKAITKAVRKSAKKNQARKN